MAQVDPTNGGLYNARYQDFAKRWEAAPLRGVPIVVHHKAFTYLENWLGLEEVAQLEPKPCVKPTSAHLVEVLDQLKQQPAKTIVRTPYNSPRRRSG